MAIVIRFFKDAATHISCQLSVRHHDGHKIVRHCGCERSRHCERGAAIYRDKAGAYAIQGRAAVFVEW